MKSEEEIRERIESLKVNNPELLENEIWQLALDGFWRTNEQTEWSY